ncbi:glycerol-3-phosphate 1-O-acyltransferase PlsY [uncultured Methylovirgula sp.]|uniref:glycerol-3-phosphate 1-O-acyltransferase PlsY n=1 Tax=uncultured Methylovirgula sp. TaxID=1285960 RepID=UPI00261B07E1|nr:glycerol-3-phosphate 1-O-acyltransferase PlsY [uncultured Methylovirgula sp.]
MVVLSSVFALIVGYACGSIPFGLLLTRLAGTADLRSIGSGNIGATNVLRTGRKDLAAATLLLDALKGLAAVLIVSAFAPGLPPLFAAAGAFLGHVFPVWLGFRGGKGVATFLGCLIGLDWHVALIFIALWLGVAAATRYSSAGALVASAATPVALLIDGRRDVAILYGLLAVLLWSLHRANIARLLAGTESKIGASKPLGDKA